MFQCLVIEDSPNGVNGAIAAGMQCLQIQARSMGKGLNQRATLILDTAESFKPELFSLPSYCHGRCGKD